ncbi:oligosaccharide flippase family protein [Chloroflexota bacterium]
MEQKTDPRRHAESGRLGAPTGVQPSILTAAKGGSILFSGRLVAYGLRFALGIIVARQLGSEQLGLLRLSLIIAIIVSGFALLGLNAALVRYVALYTSRQDKAGLWGALQLGIGLPASLSLLAAAGLFALAGPIAVGLFQEPELIPLLRIASLVMVSQTLLEVTAAATRGSKDMQHSAVARQILVPAMRLLLTIVLSVTIGLTAALALGVYAVAMFAAAFTLLYSLDKLFSLRRPLNEARHDSKEILGFALPVYLSGRLSTFSGSLRALFLGAWSTPASVGVFSVAIQASTLGTMFHASLGVASAPIIAELHDGGDWEQMKIHYQTMTRWILTMNLPVFLIVVLFPGQLLSIFGRGFAGGALALRILAFASLARAGAGISGTVIDMTGHTRIKVANTCVVLALSVALGLLLIPGWDVTGAAVGALGAAAIASVLTLVEVFILYRLQPYNASYLKPIVAGLVAAIAGLGMYHLLPLGLDLIRAAVAAGILVAAYATMLLLLRFSQEDRALLAHVRRRVTRPLALFAR